MKEFFARLRRSSGSNNTIVVNGVTYHGNSVSVVNGRVFVDGVEKKTGDGAMQVQLSIKIEGDVELLETAAGDVEVSGSVGNVKSTSGDVTCGDVSGNVVTVSGDVKAGSIGGSVTTVSGDIRR